MILDVDAGNTRLKWLLRDLASNAVQRGVCSYEQSLSMEFSHYIGEIKRVRISSVKGDVDHVLANQFSQSFGIKAEFAQVIDGTAGLRCGYTDPCRLGIDRWLALLACWVGICRRAVVVDAGSALTIDVLDGQRHQGGYILPGIPLMAKALGVGTWGVQVDDRSLSGVTPGVDTTYAVNNGSLLAAVAIVEKVVKLWAPARLVVTGGDGGLLRRYLSPELDVVEVPDLVLDGLALSLP